MAKIIYVCLRDAARKDEVVRAVRAVTARLRPDNLPEAQPRILDSDRIVVGIAGPTDLLRTKGTSLAAGYLVEPDSWDRPRAGRPDGAYALFRSDDTVVEIVSDALASRTVWYVHTDSMFIASTSQRAIVALLGSFEFNPATVSWMLAAGTLGPEQSWDRRIRCLSGATCLALNRNSWTLATQTEPVAFTANTLSIAEHERLLISALRRAVGAARVSDERWAIALSGGVDCRAVLCLLEETRALRAVTWGLRASLDDPANDAFIARSLARHFGLKHEFFETDTAAEPVERVVARFVANGEGRIDHISGYVDGFSLWRRLYDSGVRGIVRGDEAFGLLFKRTPLQVRSSYLPSWSDLAGLPPLESFGLLPQSVPTWLEQQPGESLASWRDRIQQQYRAPYGYAALSDLKLAYVEIINPLISGSLIDVVRQLPDALRTDKALFARVARTLSPGIPFASARALQPADDFVKSPWLVELLRDSLSGNGTGFAVPPELAAYALDGLSTTGTPPDPILGWRLRSAVRRRFPALARRVKSAVDRPPSIDRNRLAFRVYLVVQTTNLLAADAASLGGVRQADGVA